MERHSLRQEFTWEATLECACPRGPPTTTDEEEFMTCHICATLYHKSCIFGRSTEDQLLNQTCLKCSGHLNDGFGSAMGTTDDNSSKRQFRERKPGQLNPFTAPKPMDRQYAVAPLRRRRASKRIQNVKTMPAARVKVSESDDSDIPLARAKRRREMSPTESDDSDIPLARAKRRRVASSTETTPQNIPGFVCNCLQGDLAEGEMAIVICRVCAARQHQRCMTDERDLCNDCNLSRAQLVVLAQEQRVERARAIIAQKRARADHLYNTVLWRYYCSLPNGAATPTLLQETEMKYERGRMVPAHPAPQAWVKEVQTRLSNMMEAAGPLALRFLGPEYPRSYKDEKILVPWRELAVFMVNRGPYKRHRRELGVFAELLGLERKGTYWIREVVE